MRTVAAQLPEGGGEDRVYATADTAIVLDGASAFRPVAVSPSAYVDMLGASLVSRLADGTDMQAALRGAIEATAEELGLEPGHSPSSTVAIVRRLAAHVECMVLGDNLVVFPDQAVTDDRISRVAQHHRTRYRQRLQDGHGYDQTHREILKELQAEQARHRNQPGGYWIAEADPSAADHAIHLQRPIASTPWAVLASDGAYKTMTHLGLADWSDVAAADEKRLQEILTECQRWEDVDDPNGQKHPRAKQHDDKSLAVTSFSTASRAHLAVRRRLTAGAGSRGSASSSGVRFAQQ